MKRNIFILIILLIIIGAVLSWSHFAPIPDSILFVTIDTLNLKHLSLYGYPYPTTQNLSRLARRAVRFHRVYSTASWTPPTLATLLYGGLPYQHGVVDWNTLPYQKAHDRSWVRYLKHLGYSTAFFSNHPGLRAPAPLDCGLFDRCEVVNTSDLGLSRHIVQYLKGVKKRPLLIWVHYMGAHEPFLPPPERESMWVSNTAVPSPSAPICSTDYPFGLGCIPRYIYPIPVAYEFTVEKMRARYDAEIQETDNAVAHLWRTIQSLQETWIFSLTADHGEIIYLPEGYQHPPIYFSHGTYLYEDLIHIPWILIRTKKALHPAEVHELVSQTDIPPTVVKLATGRHLSAWPGHSLEPDKEWRSRRVWVTAWEARAGWAVLIDRQYGMWWYRNGECLKLDGENTILVKNPPYRVGQLFSRIAQRMQFLYDRSMVEIPSETKMVLRSLGYTAF